MKAQNLTIALSFFTLVFFASCAKLPIYESKKVGQEVPVNSTSQIADQANSKKDIDYGTSTDDSNLYLQVCFHDQDDLSKIMMGGLYIYFDKTGKKKKDNVLLIERAERKRPDSKTGRGQEQSEGFSDRGQANSGRGMQGKQDMNANLADMISRALNKITWKKGDNTLVIDNEFYKDKIEVKLESYNYVHLMLTVKMPLDELDLHSGEVVALGIETGKAATASRQGGGASGGPGGGPGGGGPGGGGPGGGMPGGGGPGGMGGGPGGSGGSGGMQGSSSSVSPFSFWFIAQL